MHKAIEVVFYREGSRWPAQALNVEVATFGDSLEEAATLSKRRWSSTSRTNLTRKSPRHE
jgi:hypothetical protein